MVGVFVMHGRVRAPSADALDRMNRSVEYDSVSDDYARLIETPANDCITLIISRRLMLTCSGTVAQNASFSRGNIGIPNRVIQRYTQWPRAGRVLPSPAT